MSTEHAGASKQDADAGENGDVQIAQREKSLTIGRSSKAMLSCRALRKARCCTAGVAAAPISSCAPSQRAACTSSRCHMLICPGLG